MRVLVTGAAGFIGSHTAERLCARGHSVVGMDSFDDTLYPSEIKRRTADELRATLSSRHFALHHADIRDPQAVGAFFDESIDAVCHLAALAGVRPSLRRPALYVQTNVEGTVNLLERCQTLGVERFVFASSSSVYGARGDAGNLADVEAFVEDDPCLRPASPYAASKRAGELICSTYSDLYGLGVSALRFFTVYGPRQRPDMAIHRFTARIAAGAPIQMFGDGTTRRDYTYIDDIVAGVVAAIEGAEPGRFCIYNLGGTRTTELRELIAIIEEVVGKGAVIESRPPQPGDVPITYASVQRARDELGYRPKAGLREGIAAFWEWARQGRLTMLE